ncbi:MAG: hypothetical protein NTZ15_05880, partial [Burkholderiales bacterium]|nr:hypothetical protein [Burkholderiales bacterium]
MQLQLATRFMCERLLIKPHRKCLGLFSAALEYSAHLHFQQASHFLRPGCGFRLRENHTVCLLQLDFDVH